MAQFHPATINVDIRPARFAMRQPFVTVRAVRWTALHGPEDFSFAHCEIEYAGGWHRGLVYYPHPETKPAHPAHPSVVEVLAPHLADLSYGSRVTVALNLEQVTVQGAEFEGRGFPRPRHPRAD